MLETSRLILRPWQESDITPFIQMGLDPDVMHYFPSTLSPDQSRDFIKSIRLKFDEHPSWGLWAVELKQNQSFIGYIGLNAQPSQFDFSPCVEISWRLAKAAWRQGYAFEGAKAVLDYAFEQLKLERVVAFTAAVNVPSEALMKKLNMTKVKVFDHPKLAAEHLLARHVLYEIRAEDFSNLI